MRAMRAIRAVREQATEDPMEASDRVDTAPLPSTSSFSARRALEIERDRGQGHPHSCRPCHTVPCVRLVILVPYRAMREYRAIRTIPPGAPPPNPRIEAAPRPRRDHDT